MGLLIKHSLCFLLIVACTDNSDAIVRTVVIGHSKNMSSGLKAEAGKVMARARNSDDPKYILADHFRKNHSGDGSYIWHCTDYDEYLASLSKKYVQLMVRKTYGYKSYLLYATDATGMNDS